MNSLDTLEAALRAGLGDAIASLERRGGEITIIVGAGDHAEAVRRLRDDPALRFGMMVDLCGVDWRDWGNGAHDGPRFSVAMHLLSIEKNWRVRVHTFCPDDDFPMIGSVIETWPSASWFEREAFDLFGIIFEGHPDLRRILTDYGFVGHPFRKDFPISGNVEMRYDPDQKRVVYQPITIEPREITPRVVREQGYAAGPITDNTTQQ